MANRRTVFFISDRTGITAEMLGNSLLTQFESLQFHRVTIPFVDSMEKVADAIRQTSTADAPWYILPADNKWYTRIAIAQIVADTLEDLDLHVPELSRKEQRALKEARRRLRAK